jgi:cardiolipin synthase
MNLFLILLLIIHILLSSICAVHALLYKREPVAAIGWIAVCIGYPLLGPLFYYLFGINRTTRQAQRQRAIPPYDHPNTDKLLTHEAVRNIEEIAVGYQGLARLSHGLGERPIEKNNHLVPLYNGEQAYPAMLEAINNAQHYVLLTTYIFETNVKGREFIDALVAAHKRKVQVKVIIDGLGEWYSWPHASSLLKQQGIDVALFLAPSLHPFNISFNLRNHRKMLIADGQTVFMGGMNIGGRHMVEDKNNRRPVVDIQFQLTGPIAKQCENVFREDWHFLTRKSLHLPAVDHRAHAGKSFCSAFEDGPNEYLGKISTLLVNAVSVAQKSVWIMTPYFLPTTELTNVLQAAALRGVQVRILLPVKNNLPYMNWACQHILPRLLSYGVQVFYQPAPFVHSKLFIVDEYYTLVGSPNLDPRSLRLNFELMIEVYDAVFAKQMLHHCVAAVKVSHVITKDKLVDQPFLKKIRDAFFWLFTPYL